MFENLGALWALPVLQNVTMSELVKANLMSSRMLFVWGVSGAFIDWKSGVD